MLLFTVDIFTFTYLENLEESKEKLSDVLSYLKLLDTSSKYNNQQ